MKWLVIFDPRNGMSELINMAIVEADSRVDAQTRGREILQTTARLEAFALDDLADGWSYFGSRDNYFVSADRDRYGIYTKYRP